MPFAHITGWGISVPEPILTNDDIAKMVDTNDEWIRDRTGIRERHIAREDQSTSTLAVEAAIKALQVANLAPTDLDLIIVTSSSPEYIFPATACLVQDQIGATKAGAFDLLAACSGFIYAVNMAAQSIRSGSIKNALVIGSETLSRFVNWKDRNTCILFGDGAGAFVLQASDQPGGVLSAVMHSDGSGADSLTLLGGGARHPATELTVHEGKHFVQMDGKAVFRFATRVMGAATKEALELAGLTTADVDWVIPHQANFRIIETAAKYLKMPMDKFVVNVDRYGNTSTASIPIAAVEAVEKGQLKAGHKIVFVGFGAGLTWGALAAEWTGPMPAKKHVHPEQYRLFARLRSLLRRALRYIEGLLSRREL
ncbi:MAG: ketoacyl-ACP synthase III [Anaerolineales bacterium]|jgi:3-oxoacyl-[acyl-carrier-protein] synthase-3|nr:ketoacyl-ACP synthase III [Chloroflexota bacterium]MBK6647710.1 ketoacyl-ACP synthase III [Anaerolineales bacterium]MCC6987128.1 ketoacyl-ACP synthase III [Anaerolineales bacterium]